MPGRLRDPRLWERNPRVPGYSREGSTLRGGLLYTRNRVNTLRRTPLCTRRGLEKTRMNPTVVGSNHIAIEVTDAEAAAAFYQEVFGLERLQHGEGNAF